MAHTHNLAFMHNRHMNSSRTHQQSFLSGLGNKVKNVAEFAGAVKGLYDVGRGVYSAVQTIAPMVATAALAI